MSLNDNAASFQPLWANDLGVADSREIGWLWHGFLAPGMITLLTSQAKSGKTTLVAALLARLKEGGTFAGLALRPGKAVIISEESSFLWHQRSCKLGFGDQLCWFCRPFTTRPGAADWQRLQDDILRLHDRHRFDLLVIDPLIEFLPGGSENSAVGVTDFLRGLRRFAEAGMATLILHHPRKGRVLEGQAARGSSALTGFADIVMEKNFYKPGDDSDRRRRIRTYSRFDQTPRRLVLELNADATDYLNRGDFERDDFEENWRHVRAILQGERGKMSRAQILDDWPADFPAPVKTTLGRWLDRALNLGLVRVAGAGTKNSPYQYWLSEREHDVLFVTFNQMEQVLHEHKQILLEKGYFPPFADVPKEVDAAARREADERVWGKGGPRYLSAERREENALGMALATFAAANPPAPAPRASDAPQSEAPPPCPAAPDPVPASSDPVPESSPEAAAAATPADPAPPEVIESTPATPAPAPPEPAPASSTPAAPAAPKVDDPPAQAASQPARATTFPEHARWLNSYMPGNMGRQDAA